MKKEKLASKTYVLTLLRGLLKAQQPYKISIEGSLEAFDRIIIEPDREGIPKEDEIDQFVKLQRRRERARNAAPESNAQSSTATNYATAINNDISTATNYDATPRYDASEAQTSTGPRQTVTVSQPDVSNLPKRSVPPAVLVELQNEPIPEYYDPEEEVDFSPEENLIRRRLYKVTSKFNVEWSTDEFGDLTCTLVNEDKAVNKLLARFEEWLQDNGIEMMPERILGTATDGAQKLGMPHTVRTFAVVMMALTPRDLGRMCDLVGEGEVKDVIVRFREENEDLIPLLIEND